MSAFIYKQQKEKKNPSAKSLGANGGRRVSLSKEMQTKRNGQARN